MKITYRLETAAFVVLLGIFNFPGLVDGSVAALFPSALFNLEIWRWFTFPWAHLSFYHLVLDATSFLCLYNQLRGNGQSRAFHLSSCILFSGLVPILLEPRLEAIGLRGLSGVAHGLMIVTALEALSSEVRLERTFSIAIIIGVIAKCMIEQINGRVLFADWHLGYVGFPVASCHLGGALGGILSFWLGRVLRRDTGKTVKKNHYWKISSNMDYIP